MRIISFFDIGWQRWRTHALLALLTLLTAYIVHRCSPYADLDYILTVSCGYVSLGLIALSLIIGPLKLLTQRRNPVNINLRRDIGIWAGITGCVHVICVLLTNTSNSVIYLFLRPKPRGIGYDLLLTPQGISNNLGLVAAVILIALLALSNDASLRRFKGKRWKALQRFNYGLIILALIHTVLYQRFGSRPQFFIGLTYGLVLVTLVLQTAGFFLYSARRTKTHSAYNKKQTHIQIQK